MIDDPIVGAIRSQARGAQKNHYVVREFLHPGLKKEEQIAGLSLGPIAADKNRIKTLQRSRICELGNFPAGQIARSVWSIVSAKKFVAQLMVFRVPSLNIRRSA